MEQKSRLKLWAIGPIFLGLILLSTASTVIQGQRVYYNGLEFFAKGVLYEPVPLGIAGMNSDGYGGGGLCSAKLTPYNEWKSACYDHDFFDGSSSSAGRVPPGPGVWFQDIWLRDFSVFKQTGVNLVKISSLNSMTEAAAKASVGHDGVVNGYGKDHTDFFDQCEKNNIAIFAPIYPNDAQSLMSETTASWQKKVQNLLDEIGNHKALYAFYIGSDWGLNEPSQSNLLQRVNEVMDYVHSHSNAKITTCVSSIPTSAPSLIPTLHWDFVCANAGWDAGSGLSSFLGDANSSTSNSWSALAKQHGLPIILGEAGVANSNSSFISDHPHFFNDLLQSTLSFYSKGIVGQVFVSYSDDPTNGAAWKRYLGFMTPVVQSDGLDNSTQPDIFWADGLNQKAGLYDSVVSGTTSDGSTLNYNTNVFTFMGRDPQAVTPSAKATPNSSTPTSARSPSLLSLAIVLVCSLIAIIRY